MDSRQMPRTRLRIHDESAVKRRETEVSRIKVLACDGIHAAFNEARAGSAERDLDGAVVELVEVRVEHVGGAGLEPVTGVGHDRLKLISRGALAVAHGR